MEEIIYVCINPNCDSYLDEVKISIDVKKPCCTECAEELQEE